MVGKSLILGPKTPEGSAMKFSVASEVYDIVTHANFGEDRLRGFGVAMGRILAFSIDLLCRLYNTLALPCECVIIIIVVVVIIIIIIIIITKNDKMRLVVNPIRHL